MTQSEENKEPQPEPSGTDGYSIAAENVTKVGRGGRASPLPVLAFRGLCAIFVHSNVKIPLGPFGLLLGDPVLHRWHHARVERCEHNCANLAPYLDVIFGTHHRPCDESFALGLSEEFPPSFALQMAHPFRRRQGNQPDGQLATAEP